MICFCVIFSVSNRPLFSSACKEVSPVAGVAVAVKVQYLGIEPSDLVLMNGQCLVVFIVVEVVLDLLPGFQTCGLGWQCQRFSSLWEKIFWQVICSN